MAKTKVGRPSLKKPDLIETILTRIMGGQNLVQLCEAEDMPHRDTIHLWLAQDEEFSDKYARACKIRREYKFYELEHRAESIEDVARARLMIDVVKWQLSKEDPKKYGDKVDVTSGGEVLGATVSPEQAAQLVAARAARKSADI